jgi:hypothetical protein
MTRALSGAPKTADSTRSEFSVGMNENHAKLLLRVWAFESSTTWRCIPASSSPATQLRMQIERPKEISTREYNGIFTTVQPTSGSIEREI